MNLEEHATYVVYTVKLVYSFKAGLKLSGMGNLRLWYLVVRSFFRF